MEYQRAAWVEVDLGAIAHNVRALNALTPKATRLMAVVKADGYGHGSVEVAQTALAAGAERLGVATVEEALLLRQAGIAAPVHILSQPPAEAVELLIEHDIITTVTDRDFAASLSRAATRRGAQAVYHLKVDTGMNRIGVRAEDAAGMARWLRDLPGLFMEGVFTHFATADDPGDWDFARQEARFSGAFELMRNEGIKPHLVHAANSAATILHPETHLDMVRCGITIYGLHPSAATVDRVDLKPAMQVKARVSFVKEIGLGEGVSYGLTWQAPGRATIATLPLGYADGVHRVLSNQMDVLIGGRRCQQVGRVCMDQLMVEVPAGTRVQPGDEAVLVGAQGRSTILLDELAEAAGTINYEMACGFALRMTRRYTLG